MRSFFNKHRRGDSLGRQLSEGSETSSVATSIKSSSSTMVSQSGPFIVSISSDCNKAYRKTMEDVHTVVTPFLDSKSCGYFAVYDGHAGQQVSERCGQRLHTTVAYEMKSGVPLPEAFHSAFNDMDRFLGTQSIRNAGSTAGVAIIRWEGPNGQTVSGPKSGATRKLYVANVGDTRVVLSRRGRPLRLSYDHRGTDVHERKRITNAGGIMMNNRVNGVLAVTRALGDLYMKDFVLGDPYTTETVLQDDDEFVIIACDGLWDVCSDSKAVDIVRKAKDITEASAALLRCALDAFSTDNITIMVIQLNHEAKLPFHKEHHLFPRKSASSSASR